MINSIVIITFILLTVSVASFVLAFLVFLKKKKDKVGIVYFIFGSSQAMWSFCMWMYMFLEPEKLNEIVLWTKLLYFSGVIISFSFFSFSFLLTKNKFLSLKKTLCFLIPLGLFFYLIFYTNTIVGGVVIEESQRIVLLGDLYFLYFVTFVFMMSCGLANMLFSSFNAKDRKRSQLRVMLIGLVIPIIYSGLVNITLPIWRNFEYAWTGPIALFVTIVSTSYAIVAHRLMDIKFVMRRYMVFIVSFLIVLIPATLIKYFTSNYLIDYSVFVDIFLLSSGIAIYPSVRYKTFRLANKYFFSSLYDSSQLIAKISDDLRSSLDINQVYNFIYHSIDNAMHISSFGVLSYEDDKKLFATRFNINFNIGRRVYFKQNDYLQEYLVKNNKPIVLSEFKARYLNKNTEETIALLEGFKVEILCPLIVKNRVVGLMVLGPKESGDMYNDEDLQVLSIVSGQSAIAIENAVLYAAAKRFGERMEEEVQKATADLRAANERLKKLDEAKSEFISIASHQLRTPLTVIKGYISMMLEGGFGDFPDASRDSLEKVFESNERLVKLVENLLNISRIESGRLKFNYNEVQMEEMIESVIWEMEKIASDKGVDLVFKKQKRLLPPIYMDDEKIRQVVINLIDNAVKYTNKGSVVVSLSKKGANLVFRVKDSGIGIKPEDMPNMFKKFSRGTGAALEHAEGTGLGLFVAKQMIGYHNGKIWAESKGEGKGTTFIFELPIEGGEKK